MTLLRATHRVHSACRVFSPSSSSSLSLRSSCRGPLVSISSPFSSSFSAYPTLSRNISLRVFCSEYSTKAISPENTLSNNNIGSSNAHNETQASHPYSSQPTQPSQSSPSSLQSSPSLQSEDSLSSSLSSQSTTCTNGVIAPIAPIAIPSQPVGVTDVRDLIDTYLSLSKVRLSALVIVTTMAGYVLAPAPFYLSTFLYSSAGTALAIASANTFNQIYEVANDAKISRTNRRILPTGKISIRHATLFGAATGLAGPAFLLYTINPLAAALAFSNIALYAGIYTPLKRVHPINTWVGSIVGAIPPAIGWVAATNSLDMGAWVLGGLLFVWQIPHFLALSWGLRKDYSKAGYKMLSTENPEMLPKLCLRYCIYLMPIGPLSWWAGVTDVYFAFDSLLVNAYFTYYAYQFYQDNSNAKARKLFFASVIYLPVFLALMLLHATKFRSKETLETAAVSAIASSPNKT